MISFILFNFGEVTCENDTINLFQFFINLIYELIGGFLFIIAYQKLLTPIYAFFRVKKLEGKYYHFSLRDNDATKFIYQVGDENKECYSIIKANLWKPYTLSITSFDYSHKMERIWKEEMVIDSKTLLTAGGNFIYTDTSEVGWHEYFFIDERTILVKIILPDNKIHIYYFKRAEGESNLIKDI